MNDVQLTRNIQSVGMSFFVKYFDSFISPVYKRVDVIELLKNETNYTEKSCISRTSHASSIIRSGRAVDALRIIINSTSSKVCDNTKKIASKYIEDMK